MHLPDEDDKYEEYPEQDIANIAPYVVESTEHAQWVGTFEIVIALVLIATAVKNLQRARGGVGEGERERERERGREGGREREREGEGEREKGTVRLLINALTSKL